MQPTTGIGKLIMGEASLGPRRKAFYSSFSPPKMLYWVVARSLVGVGGNRSGSQDIALAITTAYGVPSYHRHTSHIGENDKNASGKT